MTQNAREQILLSAKAAAQLHGYGGINFRTIAEEVGIKNASIYYHFPSKADLGAAVAERYWQETAQVLSELRASHESPEECLRLYPSIFRKSIENQNRLCLSSFMAAEVEDLPDQVTKEVRAFADVNVEWLVDVLADLDWGSDEERKRRAYAIYTAVAGAQLIARTRQDINLFDELVSSYLGAGLIPARA